MWFTCFICQQGCTGSSQYASVMSDLDSTQGESGFWWCMERKNSARCCKLSNGYPMMSSQGIMLFSEWFPALWWVTIWRSVEWGFFSMAKTGMQYIPGRSFSPKASEKCLLRISWSCWSCKKLSLSRLSVWGYKASNVSGYPPLSVSAYGQKPSWRPRHTDLTKGWLGWDFKCFLKQST